MELKQELKFIFSQFKVSETFKDFKTFSSGHINDTYFIKTVEKPHFVLQKINGSIFTKAKEVIENKSKATSYLLKNNAATLQYINSKENQSFVKDAQNNYWNLCYYIEDSITYLKVESNKIATEAGKITGSFLNEMKNFPDELVDVLPNFHNMTFRYSQFHDALKSASEKRKEISKNWINFCISKKEEMTILDRAILNKEIPLRIIHNDTKISNILFSNNEKAICLIDLDTVMQGIIHFDFGDALRTICSTAVEDETKLELINFNFEYFKNYTNGFLEATKNQLTKNEIKYLPLSPKIITFIMGLRFLTDYLNNNVYYKTKYEAHNLDRAKNQFTLVNKIIENQDKIRTYILNNVS